uniref:Uncharacterized protein n=1 Tax=Panagrolaimus sp. ES5 TaxID=591445 RepID=A0AC34GFV0_9BILA
QQQQQRFPRSSGSLGLRRARRKPKRNADPIGFQEWQASDREFWKFVTKILRNWRATEGQCSATRRPITFFQDIKYKVKSDRKLYQTELDAYRQTLRDHVSIPSDIKYKVKSDRKLYQTELDAYRQTLRDHVSIPPGQSFDLP